MSTIIAQFSWPMRQIYESSHFDQVPRFDGGMDNGISSGRTKRAQSGAAARRMKGFGLIWRTHLLQRAAELLFIQILIDSFALAQFIVRSDIDDAAVFENDDSIRLNNR